MSYKNPDYSKKYYQKNKKRIRKYQKKYQEKYGEDNIYGNRFIDKPHVQRKIQEAMKEQFPEDYYKRNKIKINQEPNKLEKTVELHQQGLINKDISERLDLAPITVTTYLRKVNLNRNFSERQYKIIGQVLELNQQGYTNSEISREIGVQAAVVTYNLKKLNMNRNEYKISEQQIKRIYERIQQIVELNQQGWVNNKIAKYLEINPFMVSRDLRNVGISRVGDEKILEKDQYKRLEQIVELNQQGLMNRHIANQLGINEGTVTHSLRRTGMGKNKTHRSS